MSQSSRPNRPLHPLAAGLLPLFAALAIRGVRATTRLRYRNRGVVERLDAARSPYILAFWHARLFLMPYAYPGRRIAILISEHRDGEIISRTMRRFGFETARGSTTRRGASGLREIVRCLRSGSDAAFTPDGPRGPREVVQPGVVAAARLTGAPIVPVSFSASKKNSWGPGTGFSYPSRSAAAGSSTVSRSA